MNQDNQRRAPARSRAAEKQAEKMEQLTVLVFGALALLGFLVTV